MQKFDQAFLELVAIVKQLRSENGCPWDKKQTFSSLVKYLHEEFDELLSAISNNDFENVCEESGDFLFLLVMLSQIGSEGNHFTLNDVINGISQKLIRRHPHVFAGVQIKDEEQLRKQWENIKAEEKLKRN